MNYKNDNSLLSYYLKKLNNTPLLKRAEEVALVEKIEVSQNKILGACVKYEFFISEFQTLLRGIERDHDGIISLTRLLDANSTNKDVDIIRKDIIVFEDLMDKKVEYQALKTQALDLNFTGNVINLLVTKIYKKYT